MSKYNPKNKKKQDIMDKSTKKKRKNGVLAYFMEKLVSENLVSENTLELVKECNTFMMMVADETLEKKKQHRGNTCKNRFRSEEHTSELQSRGHLVCRLLLNKKK